MHASRGSITRRAVWSRASATWRSYPPRQPPTESFSIFVRVPFSDPIFKGSFGGLLVLKMGHAAYRRKALNVYFPTIPVKRENATGEPRVARRSQSRHLSERTQARGSTCSESERLCARRRLSGRKNAFYSQRVPDSRESELGFVRYGSSEQRPPGVFLVRLRTVFRSGFRLDPGKSWRSESSTSCMNVSSFQRARACGSTCCESGRLCAQARQRRWESSGIFSTALFRRPVFMCVVDVAPDIGSRRSWYRWKACATYFSKVQALHLVRDSGSRWDVPYAKGSSSGWDSGLTGGALDDPEVARAVSSIQLLVWSTVRSNLGQTWSTSVKALQSSGKCIPEPRFEDFLGMVDPIWIRNGSVKPWSTLGQPWSNLVKLGSPNSGKCVPDHVLRFFRYSGALIGSGRLGSGCLVLRADTRENPVVRLGLRASPSRIQIGIPGLGEDRSGCEKTDSDRRSVLRLYVLQMSDRGSGSGGHRRSDRLAKGKAVVYAPESSPDTDDEYDAMEDVRTRADASIARNLQAELDAEASGLVSSVARPSSRPGVVIGRSARPSEATRPSSQPSVTTGRSDTLSDAPRRSSTRSTGALPTRLKRQRAEGTPYSAGAIPEDFAAPGFRYPPQGGIRPRYPVIVEIFDTPLLTNLLAHPSSLVRRCQDPPESVGRGGWSDFSRLLAISRREYREFLTELGFGLFLGIPYVSVYHPAPPSEPISGPEAMEILGLDDPDSIDGTRLPSVRVRYLADILRRDREEPPTELRYRQWAAYFIFSCFLGNDKSTFPTPVVGMFRDVDALREYDWGALTYGFYIRGLRRFSRRESISFLGFWQFTIFWAFEHFPTFAPSRLPLASDPDFPLAKRWDSSQIRRLTSRTLLEFRTTVDCIRDADIVFQPYSPGECLSGSSPRGCAYTRSGLSRLRGFRVRYCVSSLSCQSARIAIRPIWIDYRGKAAQREGEMAQMRADLAQRQRDLDSRDAELAIRAATIRRLEDQLQGVGIPPVNRSWLVWFRSDFFSTTT
uniref:Aminotransferase-like plant mobile domain-containing protein n=1 Tax=Fagus sylvatica TaxID=28930 RepID=A0A2N9EG23_FAGSY